MSVSRALGGAPPVDDYESHGRQSILGVTDAAIQRQSGLELDLRLGGRLGDVEGRLETERNPPPAVAAVVYLRLVAACRDRHVHRLRHPRVDGEREAHG